MLSAQATRFSVAFTTVCAMVIGLLVAPGALIAGAVPDGYSAAPSSTGVAAISAGGAHSCALLGTGQLSCWGYNFPGQLGTGNFDTYLSPSPPIELPGSATAVAVATGASHTCAVLNSGEVSCWGVGSALGTGDFFSRDTPSAPIALPGGATATAISAGTEHSCAVLSTGEVSCWGVGRFGQLGTGDTSDLASPSAPIALPGGATATAISAGNYHTCALLDTGEVSCWGKGGTGELGTGVDGDSSSPAIPVVFPDGATAVAVSAGSQHSCAVLDTGEVSCWGFRSQR